MQVNYILKNKSSLVHKIGQWNSVQQGIRFKIRFSTVPIIILYCNICDDITALLEKNAKFDQRKVLFAEESLPDHMLVHLMQNYSIFHLMNSR